MSNIQMVENSVDTHEKEPNLDVQAIQNVFYVE